MPSKIAPMSFRLPPELRAGLKAKAEALGITVHVAGLEAFRRYVEAPVDTPRQVLAHAEAKAAHLAKPKRKWSV